VHTINSPEKYNSISEISEYKNFIKILNKHNACNFDISYEKKTTKKFNAVVKEQGYPVCP
jgi:hypothetical protein